MKGRIYVGMQADERTSWARDFALDDARIGVEATLPGVYSEVEADLSSPTPLRDAYVRLDLPASTRVTAGRFKAPFSRRQLQSSWKLPLVSRGMVDQYLVGTNGLGGRHLGATASLRPWGGPVEIEGGLFSGPAPAPDAPSRQDASASISVRPWRHVEAGLTSYRQGGSRPATEAASAYLDAGLGPAALALEGYAGRAEQGEFRAGTALLAYAFRIAKGLDLSPVVGTERIQLRGGSRGMAYSAMVGAVLSRANAFKVRVEGERARRPGEITAANTIAVQLATRF